jgi:hypothetical protein
MQLDRGAIQGRVNNGELMLLRHESDVGNSPHIVKLLG